MLPHFIFKKGILTFGNVKLNRESIKEFSNIGLPSFFSEVTFSIIIYLANIAIVKVVGEEGLAAYSIMNYLTTNVYMVLFGVAIGVQPLISYNYGAKNKEKMLKFHKMTNIACLIVNIVFTATCFVFGREIIGVFTSNIELIEMTYVGLNLMNLSFFPTGVNLAATIYYQAIEMPGKSNLICALRSVIVFPICLIILSLALGADGIWVSTLVSESITIVVMILVSNLKKSTELALGV
ncbi:MatE protein [Clostridium sp. DSM 8431]|uniref:MATE family efflux transporter n=1 Tax=Clostridium sp. DSM 8431 TaxID=1761781 RepID=UPI0008E1D17D|nr:MATE family efflux transporter [Clostridium sp. DSM 8431]SFU43702.1 MatE protein [Clostridium sp. DSM 8431]